MPWLWSARILPLPCVCFVASSVFAQVDPDDLDAGPAEEAAAATPASELRGLLASAPFDKQPIKAMYFFPGESADSNRSLYTSRPSLEADARWNSDPSTRTQVIDRMVAAHVNTVVMSYWGDEMRQWSPMQIDDSSISGVVDAVSGKPIVIIPSLESGYDGNNPDGPHWRFCEDFPYASTTADEAALAPTFLARLYDMVELFRDRRSVWAQLYDRDGLPRYVVHVMLAYALRVPEVAGKSPDQVVADAFDAVAARIKQSDGIDIGFTLDIVAGGPGTYELTPSGAGHALGRSKSMLAVQLFLSEARSGRVMKNAPWEPPFDNNEANLDAILDDKLRLLGMWLIAGLPVVYDVTPGFDGRFVWAEYGTGFWGDNYAYTTDDWRNLQSESLRPRFIGVSFNTWNGYTEGYAATPTVEHGTTIYDWVTDLYRDDPRLCHHVEYEDGRAAYRIDGPICDKWRSLDGRRGVLGEPISSVTAGANASFAHFAEGSVFASPVYGVFAVHGPIHDEYRRLGFETSCLGLPIADQEAADGGSLLRFERGTITLPLGAAIASARCDTPQ